MSPEISIRSAQAERLQKPYSVVIPDASRIDLANTISVLTTKIHHANGDMLAKTPQEMLDIFSKGHAVFLTDKEGKFLSHAAVTFEYPDGSIEVGAVCTNEEELRKGYGEAAVVELLKRIGQDYPEGQKVFALANDGSKRLFQKVGGVVMPISKLHKGVFDACKNCLRRPSNQSGEPQCCDIPYDLTNAVQRIRRGHSNGISTNGTNGANHVSI